MSMKELAKHIIAVAHDNNLSVSNLQLQKVMYFAFKKFANDNKNNKSLVREFYDDKFLVWKYGPVIEDIYEEYRVYGSTSISECNKQVDKLKSLNDIIEKKLNCKPFMLVEDTHKEKFWKDHEVDITGWRSNIEYSIEDIMSTK